MAAAAGQTTLLEPDDFELTADVRVAAMNGETSWLDGGFGKVRGSRRDETTVEPQLGNVDLVWKPELSWSVGAIVSGRIEGGTHPQAGLSQAYLTYKPLRSEHIAISARGGLMWPPISLEHEGADWHVRNSITPSAINSWVGEEIKPLALEGTVAVDVGADKLKMTAAAITANDTAGTQLTFRGWALHDRTTLAFASERLPPLGPFTGLQAPYTHPLADVHPGFAKHLGYYAKVGWQSRAAIRLEIFTYDNRADPEDVTSAGPEWGWRTRFTNVGLLAAVDAHTDVTVQALEGTTRMGFRMPTHRWVDERFSSAYVMLDHSFRSMTIAIRGDTFRTRARGSIWDRAFGESGHAAMLSVKRDWHHLTGLAELLHVTSKTPARTITGEEVRVPETLGQLEMRMRW